MLFSHSLRGDGAPTWLLRVAELLLARGHAVDCIALTGGPLKPKFEAAGARVLVARLDGFPNFSAQGREQVLELLDRVPAVWQARLWVFNTVLWANLLARVGLRRTPTEPRRVWVLHNGHTLGWERVEDGHE